MLLKDNPIVFVNDAKWAYVDIVLVSGVNFHKDCAKFKKICCMQLGACEM